MIYTLGESLLDHIYKNNELQAKKAGGAMLNTAISLGKVELNIALISEVATDKPGVFILNFLESNNVSTNFIYRFSEGKSAIANANLDMSNEASYQFEKDYPEIRLNIDFPEFREKDILLFGSFYALDGKVYDQTSKIVDEALINDVVIIYDPNIRKDLRDDELLIARIKKNINRATIIRASDEDFNNIFDTSCFNEACSCIPDTGNKIFIYTAASRGIYLKTPGFIEFYEIPKLKVVSSIGAGDSFNAGLIYSIDRKKLSVNTLLELQKNEWDNIIQTAISFASNVCLSLDNYISDDFVKALKN